MLSARTVNSPMRRQSQARARRFDTGSAAVKLGPMSKTKLRQKPEKKKPGLRIPTKYTTWLVVGVVGAALGYLIISSLSRPPAPPGSALLGAVSQDLVSITRMLGDVAPDSSFHAVLPDWAESEFGAVDSLLEQRRFDEAQAKLSRMARRPAPGRAGLLHAYIGLTLHEADHKDRALDQFRAAADSADRPLAAWSAFAAGYLFQSHGYQDSAITWYDRALLADSLSPLRKAALNNAGVAWETLKEYEKAREFLAAAAALLDSADSSRSARTLRENLQRVLNRPAPAAQP